MSNGQVDLGRLKFPLWGPATKALSILVVVVAGFIAYTRFIKPEFVDPDTLPMPTSEVMQLKEIAFHFTEDPCAEFALNGVGEVEHYCSDDCVATFYEWQGRRVPKINFHPRRLIELEMEVEVAGFLGVWQQKECGCPELDCLPPWEHPGPFDEREILDQEDECVVWIVREFADCCVQHQRFDRCAEEWLDAEPAWDCCIHRLNK